MNMTTEEVAAQPGTSGNSARPPDRRARHRQETIAEILDIAAGIMTEEGVNGLNLAEIARRLGVQPPSLYRYFPSLIAVYDELFRRGQAEHLAIMRHAMSAAEPGLDALISGLEASGRWLLANRAIAQLMFWRPVPSFEPTLSRSVRPSVEMVALERAAMTYAVAAGQLGPEADSDEAVYLVSTLIVGVLSQAMANEPGLGWGEGRFTSQFPRLMKLLIAAYPPDTRVPKRRAATP